MRMKPKDRVYFGFSDQQVIIAEITEITEEKVYFDWKSKKKKWKRIAKYDHDC